MQDGNIFICYFTLYHISHANGVLQHNPILVQASTQCGNAPHIVPSVTTYCWLEE